MELLFSDLYRLDLAIQLVDIRQQAEVPLLQTDEDLDDLLYIADAGGGFDGSERLLEDLDVFLVLLDMPPLDGVKERQLEDAPLDGHLREGLLLVRYHVGLSSALAGAPESPIFRPVMISALLPSLDVQLLSNRLLHALHIVLEQAALALQQLVPGAHLLFGLLARKPVRVDLGRELAESLTAARDSELQLLEVGVQYLPLFSQLVNLLSQVLVICLALVQVRNRLLQVPLELSNLCFFVRDRIVLSSLEQLALLALLIRIHGVPGLALRPLIQLVLLPLLAILRLRHHEVFVHLVEPPLLQLELPGGAADVLVKPGHVVGEVGAEGAASDLSSARAPEGLPRASEA
mmetsp:Transcript_49997/g.140625  ORF Transcript_49997/g.140625 Transcript_49997/m.140625 type:complete len:347 (-) Transcript_49997:113-1153(-)